MTALVVAVVAERRPAPGSASPRSAPRSRPRASPSAIRAAWRQQRSTRSATPSRPRMRQRRPHVDGAGPARAVGRVVHRVADARGRQIGGASSPSPRAAPRRRAPARCRSRRARSATCARRWPTSRPARSRRPAPRAPRPAARAHRPNAPSTCTQAPWSWAQAHSARAGSNAPVFTLPAWRQTIAGPARRRQVAGDDAALAVDRQHQRARRARGRAARARGARWRAPRRRRRP